MKRTVRRALPALFCLLCLLLSGCSELMDREYRFEEPYEEEYTALRNDPTVQEVRNYVGMTKALTNLINGAAEYGILRTSKYSGAVGEDISRACFEVTRETPMGVYAVDYMTHSVTQIVSYYEIEVYITYKRSAEEIAGILTLHSANELQELLADTVRSCGRTLTVMQVSTDISEEDIRAYLEECYCRDPLILAEKPKLTVNVYSTQKNIQKIMELELEYEQSSAELERRGALVQSYLLSFFAEAEDEPPFAWLCRRLTEDLEPWDRERSLYDALFTDGRAGSETYALLVKALCDQEGIGCYAVRGRMQDEDYYWNIVEIDGVWYHVDLYEADLTGTAPAFRSDEEMYASRRWDTGQYPVCEQSLVPEGGEEPAEEDEPADGEETEN